MSFLCSGGAWPWGSLFARGGSAHPLDLGSNLSLIKTQKCKYRGVVCDGGRGGGGVRIDRY